MRPDPVRTPSHSSKWAANVGGVASTPVDPGSTGQVVLFPVLGTDRVILLIYTDNGPLDQPIEEIDIIDLAASEVGIAFENELLRRQLQKK